MTTTVIRSAFSATCLKGLAMLVAFTAPVASAASVARDWDEEILAAIRLDFPNPPVHARNLHHLSTAMWDAWAAYDPAAAGFLHNETATAGDLAAARREAISYAAYRILRARFAGSAGAATTIPRIDAKMAALGYSTAVTTTAGTSPAAVGNRVAQHILTFSLTDGSNEQSNYFDPTYDAVNDPLIILNPGTTLNDPNRWQPLAFDVAFTQNGLEATKIQRFVASQWNDVRPFCLSRPHTDDVYFDPGAPPYLGGVGDALFKEYTNTVIRGSAVLDPDSGVTLDISPGGWGNNSLGQNDGHGRPLNPVTGLPYTANVVKEGDFGRILAEFWADGPDSETPPGHWNVLANEVTDSLPELRIGGTGPLLDPLEWDVKLYFTLNAAVHDVAVAVWGCKRHYDFVRPISAIRYMGMRGQSSDSGLPSYDPLGLKLEPGLVELITAESAAPGQRHAHLSFSIGQVAIKAWGGQPVNPVTQFSGAEWILPANWMPYQRSTFVTPAFAGYVSGHSGFSRAGAEVLTAMTGSAFFPGGMGTYTAAANSLKFEAGPATPVTLQWATYYDAADQAGLSRIYGGIHFPCDDGPGRIVGALCGQASVSQAAKYFDGSILTESFAVAPVHAETGWQLEWPTARGLYYKAQRSTDLSAWSDLTAFTQAGSDRMDWPMDDPAVTPGAVFYRVLRQPSP